MMAIQNSVYIVSCLLMICCCSAQNGPTSTDGSTVGSLTTTTQLNLIEGMYLRVDKELQNQTKSVGGRLTMDCDITGYPTPVYTWYKDGVAIQASNTRYQIRLLAWGNRLKLNSVKMEDGGQYTCRAESLFGMANTTATLLVIPAQPGADTNTGGNGNNNNDNTDSSSGGTETSEDAQLVDPFCQNYRGTYCGFLKTKEIYVTSRLDQANAEFKILDLVRELTEINMPVTSQCFIKSVEASCYNQMPVCRKQGTGAPMPVRLCRRECEALFPVCRPEFRDDTTKWKLLPECSELDNEPGCISIGLTAEPSTTTQSKPADSLSGLYKEPSADLGTSKSLTEIGLPAALGVALVVGIIIAVVCIIKKRKSGSAGSGTRSSSNGSHVKSAELSNLSDKGGGGFVKEVTLDNINMLQELGKCYFGTVYHGQAFGLYGSNTASAVYIKCLEEGHTADQLNEFNEERSHMSDIRHQNILSLLAVSIRGAKLCLLYEYLQMGDLRLSILNQQSHGMIHSTREIMYIVTQVASSLEYLSIINFVHKDIAAHNVMVSHNMNVKLSTLKIIHGVHSANYCALHNTLLPVRWLPPETITYNKFSLETDVYSFGVFLWECFSIAQLPYNGYSSQEVVEMIRSRQLLACPQGCPPRIYSLMMECWHENPSKRPSAKEVHQKLRSWYLENTDLHGGLSATSASSAAPSQHSSNGQPPSYPGHHSSTPDTTSMSNVARPVYVQPASSMPYYSSIIDPYNKRGVGTSTTSNSVSHDEMSEATESVVSPCIENNFTAPKDNSLTNNYYTNSTPNQRFASLGRRKADTDFIPQTTPLFHETDQV